MGEEVAAVCSHCRAYVLGTVYSIRRTSGSADRSIKTQSHIGLGIPKRGRHHRRDPVVPACLPCLASASASCSAFSSFFAPDDASPVFYWFY